jgi:hypothetical protein
VKRNSVRLNKKMSFAFGHRIGAKLWRELVSPFASPVIGAIFPWRKIFLLELEKILLCMILVWYFVCFNNFCTTLQ